MNKLFLKQVTWAVRWHQQPPTTAQVEARLAACGVLVTRARLNAALRHLHLQGVLSYEGTPKKTRFRLK